MSYIEKSGNNVKSLIPLGFLGNYSIILIFCVFLNIWENEQTRTPKNKFMRAYTLKKKKMKKIKKGCIYINL